MMAPMVLEARALLFDSDGVLVDSHRETEAAWREVVFEFGLDLERVMAVMAGRRAADTLAEFLEGEALEQAIARLESLEVGLAPQTRPIAGAVELLRTLPEGSFAFATSATLPLAMARWQGAGITPAPCVVTAEDVRRGKPSPDPYLLAARRLDVSPSACVVFEDSPSGGAAGIAAGAAVVAVSDTKWALSPRARVPDLTAVSVEPGARPGELHVRLDV